MSLGGQRCARNAALAVVPVVITRCARKVLALASARTSAVVSNARNARNTRTNAGTARSAWRKKMDQWEMIEKELNGLRDGMRRKIPDKPIRPDPWKEASKADKKKLSTGSQALPLRD